MAIRIKDLRIVVGDRVLLRSACFDIPSNQLTVLVGASGSGKSTILRILAGLQKSGDVRSGVDWTGQIDWVSPEATRRVGLVFQQPALLDELSSEENIQLAIDHQPSNIKSSEQAIDKRPATARGWLEHLNIPVSTRISRLSGGQRQRLSLAQTLANHPSLIIFDEPTTGLDASHATRIASLIKRTQKELGVTSIVVTHDYESFLEIADQVLLLDAAAADVIPFANQSRDAMREMLEHQVISSRSQIGGLVRTDKPSMVRRIAEGSVLGLVGLGQAFEWILMRIFEVLPYWHRPRWGLRFFLHYARLVFGFTAILYLAVAGGIIGFVATYFTLRYMPYKIYTQPLLLEELLGAIGFAIYRILVPVLTTILVAARCGAAVSADLGNKRYGNQVEALSMLRVSPDRYLWTSVFWSFLLGMIILNQVAFSLARMASLAVHMNMQPELGVNYWTQHFFAPLRLDAGSPFAGWMLEGMGWNLIKLSLSAIGTALITYGMAMRPKNSASDVSRTITTTILWSTLWALLVHMLIAFTEFGRR